MNWIWLSESRLINLRHLRSVRFGDRDGTRGRSALIVWSSGEEEIVTGVEERSIRAWFGDTQTEKPVLPDDGPRTVDIR